MASKVTKPARRGKNVCPQQATIGIYKGAHVTHAASRRVFHVTVSVSALRFSTDTSPCQGAALDPKTGYVGDWSLI